jgi:nitrogen regulatory protein P-II 1
VKKVEAFIRHEAFEPIRMELCHGFPSLSISEVKGSGRQKGITEALPRRGADQLAAAEGQARVRV